ncbi:MAG: lysozyme [Hyphomonadaceae bacterium]|nr:lysozyme [Hyphomonadaceae bacterium]
MPHAVSPEGLSLLKRLEGFRAEPLALADGRFVAGYGHVLAMAPNEKITEQQAEAWLRADLAPVEAMLADRLLAPASQPQFDALASFAFSIGAAAFVKSDVLRRFNAGEPIAAACAMDAWRKSRVGGEPAVLDALVRRRAAEKAVFLDLTALVPAPSAFVAAEIDHAAAILGQPTKVQPLPTAASRAETPDETARKLAQILAADPNTAHALKPPPAAALDEEDAPPVLVLTERAAPAPAAPADLTGLALFGVAGAGLFAAGLVGLNQGKSFIFLLLAAPGAVMLGAAAWRLLKDGGIARLGGALRG